MSFDRSDDIDRGGIHLAKAGFNATRNKRGSTDIANSGYIFAVRKPVCKFNNGALSIAKQQYVGFAIHEH